jgi:ABC-type uncharacterized transport system auxiliary subunit
MRSILLLPLVMAAASCVSSRPIHYYTIEPPSLSAGHSKTDGLVLLVGNIATAETLRDGRIRYRSRSNEAGAYEYHRWSERPASMVRESLVRTLQASGKYRRVLEASSSAIGDYLVRARLHEFGEVDGESIQSRISLRVELVATETNRNVWDRLLEREEPVSGKTVADVVQSLDRNLQHVADDISAELDKFLSSSEKH